MTILRKAIICVLFCSFWFANAQNTTTGNLKQHVFTLASDSLKGRKAGSEESTRAARYIVEQWQAIGIKPYKDNDYFHSFDKYKNIIGIIEGGDENRKNEFIVIGAHYDHLGFKIKDNDTIIYNGADDNASGTAALIETARMLKNRQNELKRSVILVAFDAEEIGLVGSKRFVTDNLFSSGSIKLMMSVDMVGWYSTNGAVEYSGTGSIKNSERIMKETNVIPTGLKVKTEAFEKNMFVATDTQPFAQAGIPTLAVTTGLKSPYHKPKDGADLIDYDGMTLITEHLANLTIKLSEEVEITPTGKVADKHLSKRKLFQVGFTGNIGSNHHYYTDGALDGKSSFAYGIGLTTQVNLGALAFRPEVFFEGVSAKYPGANIQSNNITVPLNLVLQSINPTGGVDVFVGSYYTYRLNGKQGTEPLDFNTFNRSEWGINWGFSFLAGPVKIGYTNRSALTNFTLQPNGDNAYVRNRTGYFTLGWIF